MKILVTGGAGFIGSNFVCAALDQGHYIINIDKLTYSGSLDNLENYANDFKHTFYHEDICNREAIRGILSRHKPDVILHMAAESHVDRSIDCADDFIRTNIQGTYIMLDESLKYYKNSLGNRPFRFIHLSTDEVYGTLGLNGKFHEGMPYCPNSPYAASKASSDLLVRSYNKTYGLPTIIVNCSNNYGPKQYPEKLIPLIILNALEQKPLPIYGNGIQVRDWIYIKDHVDALFSIIKKGKIGESYCVGSNNEVSNLELVRKICLCLNKRQPGQKSYVDLIHFVKDRPGHDFRYATDYSKLSHDTGWNPKISLEQGICKTIEWYIKYFDVFSMKKGSRDRIGIAEFS